MKTYYVYLMAKCRGGTTYIGFTNNRLRRVIEHKKHFNNKSFTSKNNVERLVYYESSNDVAYAMQREKQIKKWNRSWKVRLIKSMNPEWKDLFYEIGGTDELLKD